MSILVLGGLFTIFALLFAGFCFGKHKTVTGAISLLAGFLNIFVLANLSYSVLKNGSPVAEIAPGVYKVGFVYQAGENVSLGIEKPIYGKEKDGDRLYLYQFPKKDFVGEIRTDAKKFKVLEAIKLTNGSGAFNRYELK